MKPLIFLLIILGLEAATLDVYRDGALYRYVPDGRFIGFSGAVAAQGATEEIAVNRIGTCPGSARLCQEYAVIDALRAKKQTLEEERGILESLLKNGEPKLDAESWIKEAKILGERRSELHRRIETLGKEAAIRQKAFAAQAASEEPYFLDVAQNTPVTLALPSGRIRFETLYRAKIDADLITVQHLVRLRNRSGIDIKADSARLFWRTMRRQIRPVEFTPWAIRKGGPEPRMEMLAAAPARMMAKHAAVSDAAEAQVVDAREYRLKHLELPSTGVPHEALLATWRAKVACGLEAYPYRDNGVFSVCRFAPGAPIDSDRWEVKRNGKLQKNIFGKYEKDRYLLFADLDETLQIRRKALLAKERTSGIFGSDIRRRDGYGLEIHNRSEKAKRLTIHERLPVATFEGVKVRLIEVRAPKGVTYTQKAEGELLIEVNLAPKGNAELEVLFEITHDKEANIVY